MHPLGRETRCDVPCTCGSTVLPQRFLLGGAYVVRKSTTMDRHAIRARAQRRLLI